MGIARSITQAFLKSPVLPATATVAGWLKIDRLFDNTWRWTNRGRVRRMLPAEIDEAERVFGHTIPYLDVRLVESSPVAARIARLSGQVHMAHDTALAVTIFNTIHFERDLRPDNADMPWLIHELTHVWQYVQHGPRYLTDALQAQARAGKEAYSIEEGIAQGWPWERFNLEQQGDVAKAYYYALRDGLDLRPYAAYAAVLRRGLPASHALRA
jgi:hypothetical protein